LLTAVAEDPDSTLAVRQRESALKSLGVLEARMPRTAFEKAVERGQALDIEQFVHDLLN
jgi:hypothetical protein